jgi:short-subunit dehydrogenase
MVERGIGHVVLMGSAAGLVGLPHSPVYSASKAAVHAYGEGLRRRLAGAGVDVTVVCPGFVDTPMSMSLPLARPFLWTADRAAARIARAIAQKRRMLIFPWQIRVGVAAARLFPQSLVDLAVRSPRLGAKP